MKICPHLVIVLVLAVGASVVRAQTETAAETEAKATFKSLFGQEISQVAKTSSTVDDVKLAGKLLDAVGTSRDQPELMALICEKAYDLGRKNSSGYDVALEAMGVLAARSPKKKAQCLDKVVSLHELRYVKSSRADRPEIARTLANAMINACDANAHAGNIAAAKSLCMRASRLAVTARLPLMKKALQAKYKELVVAQRALKRIAGYKASLKADPSQIAAREALINIHLIERNDPAEASRWLNEDCDERLRTYIPLAAGDINAIAESTLMEMGDWYKSLVVSAEPAGKGGLLIRSLAFYEKFLEKHTTSDMARTKAVLAVTRVKADIKKYGAKVPEKTTIVTTGQFSGVSRGASVLYPQTIAGLKAWTVEPRAYLGRFYDVEFSKDSSQLITAGQDGAIRFWDVETGKLVRVLMGHDGEVRTLAWSSDRKTLASGSSDKTVRLWDPVTGKVTNILRGSTAAVSHLAWSPDSMMLACAGSAAKSVGLWSVKTGRTAGNLKLTNTIRAIAWGPESIVLGTATEDGLVSLWNARTRRPYGHYPLDPYKSKSSRSGVKYHRVNAMAWSPASTKVLALAISTGKVKLWKSRTKTFIRIMMPVNKDSEGRNAIGHPSCIEWSPDGKALAVSDSAGFVWFWNPVTGKMSRKFRDSTSQYTSVSRIAWSPDGNLVATASSDAASNLIEAETGEVARKIRSTLISGVIRPQFSADGKLMAYPCDDETIRIWDIEKCKQVSAIAVPTGATPAGALRWSPDAARIAYFARNNYTSTVRVLDVKSGVITSNLAVGGNDLIWSPDSSKIFVSQSRPGEGKIGKIQIWDVATSKAIFALSNKKISSHYGLKISPDGKMLASMASRGRVFLWSLAQQKITHAIPADEQSIRCIAFSPDGKKLASCGSEKIVKIWSVETGKPLFGFQKHESEVHRVDFSPDGTKLVSAGSYGYVGVWDLATGKNTAWFRAPNWQVRWMKDSKTLAAANKSGVYFYNAAKGTRKASYRPLPEGMGVLISAGGHYSGPEGVEKHLIYQAVGLSGQSTLTQEEFGKRFGWKNDPSKVKLFETSDKSSK